MSENNILRLTDSITDNVDFSIIKREKALFEIEFSIKNLKTILYEEKVRYRLTNDELKNKEETTLIRKNELEEYLSQINENIQTLENYVENLKEKKEKLSLDIKNLIKSSDSINVTNLIKFD